MTVFLYRRRGALGVATHFCREHLWLEDFEFLGRGAVLPTGKLASSGVKVADDILDNEIPVPMSMGAP